MQIVKNFKDRIFYLIEIWYYADPNFRENTRIAAFGAFLPTRLILMRITKENLFFDMYQQFIRYVTNRAPQSTLPLPSFITGDHNSFMGIMNLLIPAYPTTPWMQ